MSEVYDHNGFFQVRQIRGGYDKNLLHIVTCTRTKKIFLVDAPVALSLFKTELQRQPEAIFITHSHKDHIAYLDEYLDEFPDLKIIAGNSTWLSTHKKIILLEDNGILKVGDLPVSLVETPGHHPDSVCYLVEDALFTGDTLFVGRTGRIVSKESNIAELYHSVYDKLLSLNLETIIYPGHDYGTSSRIHLKENISISPLLQAESLNDFIERMNTFENER